MEVFDNFKKITDIRPLDKSLEHALCWNPSTIITVKMLQGVLDTVRLQEIVASFCTDTNVFINLINYLTQS